MLDWLFGKRYVKGWPRGVAPVFTGLRALNERLSIDYPDVWAHVRRMPPAEAFRILKALGIITV